MRFCVLGGYVWAFEPGMPIREAHRGPEHSVRHRPGRRYHDFWCAISDADGHVPYDFLSRQCRQAEALIQKEVDGIRALLPACGTGANRIVALLPKFPGVARQLKSDPELSKPLPCSSVNLPTDFHFDDVDKALHQPRHQAESIRLSLRGEIRELCGKIRFLRALQYLVKQTLNGKCLGMILLFLDSASFLPQSGLVVSFAFEDVEVKEEDSVPPQKSAGNVVQSQSADEEVTQHVQHHEPAAQRDPELTAMQDAQDWADQVAAQIQANGPGAQENAKATEAVYLRQYNRHSERFRQALITAKPLESCRSALDAKGHQWLHESGAKVFVHPWQFELVMASVKQKGWTLRPYHVIVAESLEYYLDVSLSDLPCRDGAGVKKRQALVEPEYALVEERTFLCCIRRLPAPKRFTQSTTEAHGGGLNPRRVQPESISEE